MGSVSREAFEKGCKALGKVESIDVPALGCKVDMRYPPFAVWHRIALAHRRLEGKEPPPDLIAQTVAAVLVNPDGSLMYADGEYAGVEALPPAVVMELYVAAWSGPLRGPEASDEAKKD